MITDNQAFAHPAYEATVAAAVLAAAAGGEYAVYFDGSALYVRNCRDAAPAVKCKLICIAQRWDARTVQLRFDGARSEWRTVPMMTGEG